MDKLTSFFYTCIYRILCCGYIEEACAFPALLPFLFLFLKSLWVKPSVTAAVNQSLDPLSLDTQHQQKSLLQQCTLHRQTKTMCCSSRSCTACSLRVPAIQSIQQQKAKAEPTQGSCSVEKRASSGKIWCMSIRRITQTASRNQHTNPR